ncbi:MAG TPA: GxGYxYP domain-containing protein, partial [Bacillales bacterium]
MLKKLLLLSLTLVFVLSGTAAYAEIPNSEPGKNGNIKWPDGQALPTFADAKHLDVVDLTTSTGDWKLMFATLQGIVNRERPRIYLIEDDYEEGKYTWLNDLNVPYTMKSPRNLLLKYKHEISGVVIYDPAVRDTINVATTMAGLKNAVVASPELAKKLKKSPYNLKVVEDLRGRFKNGLDAYKWQFENLWPKTTHRMLIGLNPITSIDLPEGNWDDFKTVIEEDERIRDSSNRDVYNLDLSEFLGKESVYLRFQDAFTAAGWGPSVHQITVKADGQVITQFVPGTSEEAKHLYDHGGSQVIGGGEGVHRFADGG